jgi:copper transporter 1
MTDCIVNSSSAECIDFRIPKQKVLDSIEALCDMMPRMPGCFLNSVCTNERGYCNKFSIWADICKDMPKMSGCKEYMQLCDAESVVKQCQVDKPLDSLPSTRKARELVQSICNEMDMTGCDTCMSNQKCDFFAVYLDLCKQMPEMSQCQNWKDMCEADPSLGFCLKTNLDSPTMKMYFHFGYRDYVLFDFWLPSSGGEYFLAMLFCFAFAILYEYLLHVNSSLEMLWRPKDIRVQEIIEIDESSSSSARPLLAETPVNVATDQRHKFQWTPMRIRLCRALMRFATITGAYICMLLVMSFNVGLFFSVVSGLAVGTFIWNDSIHLFQLEKEHCC